MVRKSVSALFGNIPAAHATALAVGALVSSAARSLMTHRPLLDLADLAIAAGLAGISWFGWRLPTSRKFIDRGINSRDLDGELDQSCPNPAAPNRTRRVPLSTPPREHLLAAINKSVADGCGPTVLAIIELKDFERLYAFNAESANSALLAFARKLQSILDTKHPVSHLERGSFGIWFGDSDPDTARQELRTISYALQSEIETPELSLMPEVLARVGIFPDDGADAEALLTKTSISSVSGSRPDRTSAIDAEEAKERYSLEQGLRHAVERKELTLEYQPIVDLDSGRIVGAEALIRWTHPTLGRISPATFVPLLEEMGLVKEIGMWSLNTACSALRTWHEAGAEDLSIAVNLSAKQLQDPALVVGVKRTLERHDIAPDRLTLELTETAAMQDADRTLALFHELKALGVLLSIDDFGTGYSSLSYLLKLPFDKLKIDREFVVDVHSNSQRRAICRSLVELAHGLEIGLVAEGAETAEEVNTLQQLGCQLVQGFYFSRPVSSEQLCTLATKSFEIEKPGSAYDAPLLARAQA